VPASSPDRYFQANGLRLRYRDQGQGPALILIHGWTLDLDMWDALAEALAANHRVIRADRRGFGLSEGYPSITGDAADLKALCAQLGIARTAVLGMSQGARSALQFAGDHPELTRCIILDGPPYLGPPDPGGTPPDVPFQHYCEVARTKGMQAFLDEWRTHPLARLHTTDAAAHALIERMLSRYPGKDLTAAPPATDAPPRMPAFESLQMPLLVINGEYDIDSRKRLAAYLSQTVRGVECVRIAGAGHLCTLDNPAAYEETVSRFLANNPS
jgi:3-oxoadipate enol-lactonase